jgi:hypothetical protein
MCSEHNSVAIPEMLPFYPEPQGNSTSDTHEGEDVDEPKPWLVVFGSDDS